jgi:hypothetical protein
MFASKVRNSTGIDLTYEQQIRLKNLSAGNTLAYFVTVPVSNVKNVL